MNKLIFSPWDYAKRNHTNTMEGVILASHYIKGDLNNKTIVDIVPIIRDELFYNYPGVGKDFPFYVNDDTIRNEFMNMFILKYYQYNFVHETVGYFLSRWLAKITEVNPYYEKLYYSTTLTYDPISNRNYTLERVRSELEKENATNNKNGSLNETNIANNQSDSQTIYSDNPQTNFSGVDYAASMDRGQTVNNNTNTRNNSTNENENINRTRNNDGNETETMRGFMGEDINKLIISYRNAIVNINSQLCNEFDSLFSYFN